MTEHEKYMKMCLRLAKKGEGKVSPNPLVGCVVLDKNNKIISTGYHKKYGEFHAERDALSKVTVEQTEGGTLYVNLEPCSHYGKTPPCTDIIIERKIKTVVFAMRDVNPKVSGEEVLKKAGIQIVSGVLEKDAQFLNRIFIKNMTTKMPYVVLKTATTMDGKIASYTGNSKWITSDKSRKYVYNLRKKFDCLMTSSNTIIADNPNMKHKFKCILDKDLKISKDYNIFKTGQIYIASKGNTPLRDGKLDIRFVLKDLYNKGVRSVWVESGGTLAGSLLKAGLIDEVYQFIAPKILNDNSGISAFNGDSTDKISDCVNLSFYDVKFLNPDMLVKSIVLKDI